jgi:hypothetical protein
VEGRARAEQPHFSRPVQRVVVLRGAAWRDPELEALRVWRGLLRCWPVTLFSSLFFPLCFSLKADAAGCGCG